MPQWFHSIHLDLIERKSLPLKKRFGQSQSGKVESISLSCSSSPCSSVRGLCDGYEHYKHHGGDPGVVLPPPPAELRDSKDHPRHILPGK